MTSIRWLLLKSLMTALLLGTLGLSVFTYFGTREEVNELFDGQLRQMAYTIQSQEDESAGPRQKEPVKSATPGSTRAYVKGEKEFLIQIWSTSGVLLYSSHPAINFPAQKKRGLATIEYEEEDWRVFCLPEANDIVQVSQPVNGRDTLIGEIAVKMLFPALMQFPILGFFGWMAVRRGLGPLKEVSSEVGLRTPAAMTSIDLGKVPEEIQPLGKAINELLARLDSAMTLQRQFTADAAHELRTPLAAVQLQMELLQRAKTDADKTEALQKLSQGVERCIRLAQRLLVFAKVEPQERLARHLSVRLDAMVRETLGFFTQLALKKGVDLGLAHIAPAAVQGDAGQLQILLNNLVDNAVLYTPEGGSVTVSIGSSGGRAVLEVSDNGPGIPEAERERVFDRFYRITGTKTQGTGLGLAIVRKIAEQHGADVTLHTGAGGRGLSVKVSFPA